MRILINSINFSPELTSTGKYTGELAEWLAERGHEVRVVTSPPHYPHWQISEGYSGWRYKREKLSTSAKSSAQVDIFRCPVWVPRVPRGWRRVLYLASFSLSCWPVMLMHIFLLPANFVCCSTVRRGCLASRSGFRSGCCLRTTRFFFDQVAAFNPDA